MATSQQKTPIRLRHRATSGGRQTLYLDIYINGRRSYEYLHLYLLPDTRSNKEKNRETMALAEAVCAKRLVEFRNHQYGFKNDYALDADFIEYYKSLCQKRLGAESRSNWGNWWSALKHLERYTRGRKVLFRDITPEWVQGFRDYLDDSAHCKVVYKTVAMSPDTQRLSQSSKISYFNKLRCCINTAIGEGLMPNNPMRGIESFKENDVERVYLTLDEVRAMAKTDCVYPALKNAFMFSCLTGLRKSDIEKMRWKEVQQQGEFTRIIYRQKKTGSQEYLDISPQAVQYMGERRQPNDLVFVGFKYSAWALLELREWALKAGISKHITFHSGRHTFAVLMLDLGTDIYTVQKLLGHKFVQTTQIYAHILDKNKQQAVAKIPDILE